MKLMKNTQENKLHSTYTIAAVPNTKKKGRIGPVAPIPTAMPYSLVKASRLNATK